MNIYKTILHSIAIVMFVSTPSVADDAKIRAISKNVLAVSQELSAEIFELSKLSNGILSKGRVDAYAQRVNISKTKYHREFINTLPQWTAIWRRIDSYYRNFTPGSDFEAFLEANVKMSAAIAEAGLISRYFYLIYADKKHLDLSREIVNLQLELVNKNKSVLEGYARLNSEISGTQLLTPATRNTDALPSVRGYVSLMKLFDVFEPKVRAAVSSLNFHDSSDREIEARFRDIIRDYTLSRLILGKSLDNASKGAVLSIDNLSRITAGLSQVGHLNIYLAYRLRTKERLQIAVQCLRLQRLDGEATLSLFDKFEK